MQSFKDLIIKNNNEEWFKKIRVGLEKESQRVTLNGVLATTGHPKILGSRSYHPNIQTDFSETQVELITPVFENETDVVSYLGALHEVVLRSMNEDEMLWPLSMPPVLPEKDEDIIIAKLDKFEDVLYRRYLAKSYGKRKQMVSGIHYNFEFNEKFIEKLFEGQQNYLNLVEFKTDLYLKVTRNYLRYRWLVTYLFGATPVSEWGYFDENEMKPNEPVRSIRNSKFGYTNHDDVFVSYESLERYEQDIADLIEKGKLSEEKEFYSPVRLRGGKSMADLKQAGIQYIEIRNIDNNPFASYGITEDQTEFLHIFLMYMLWINNETENPDELLKLGTQINNAVALEDPLEKTSYLTEGMALVSGMKGMLKEINASANWHYLIDKAEDLLNDPQKTISGKMVSYTQNDEFTNNELGIHLGKQYYDKAWEKTYQLEGFRDMELSTQIMIADSLQRGVEVEVIDRSDQFLKLSFNGHVEYVKNANMTSKDNYVVPLMMANKVVTKKVLSETGFRVPQGYEFQSMERARLIYPEISKMGFVVKPKSTNYGLGISIFKEGASQEDYEEALRIAFNEDTDVLVEEFLPGTEYRFFVINGKTRGIMLRVPANVVGDGVSTIEELVKKKNDNPLRGTHHRAPLELIQLGEIEQLMLKEQGLTIHDVLSKGQIAYLRENSNVSTGGDSIDMTDEIPEYYKIIAEQAVEKLGAVICGIDLIIPDKTVNPFESEKAYGIIEANFNPAMHMHCYPYQGKGRRLTKNVLDLLFPESKR
ncbi:bifunctional glutamate--cysteine ligase GshA/glutathione synthetase GshB [Vagococcus xieshaowenii]|uniref:Glutathione biosynthesis bifunctional protein GshAB n=1 Tax=Vagococcus xieshaowenii TaxID=2562451 RepID=A0A4Z0DEJ0_9ENTE|nr:bifunctional glutamate--cysteine ligase GshA/glutathione synthetase GshB [Vagococcus xieshaowenii]QCA28918.1 bifunctional glutamate--cysteine ligase GshA/glutathione synthetase GshB [Vagococcus xieshaowenii]TFZ43336.1 bifunctional glutamate--cysteine ligase GshA/glutathione synthetase GshB [Vagococcus xieshaowenii]